MSRQGHSVCSRAYDALETRGYIILSFPATLEVVGGRSVDSYLEAIKELTEGMRRRLALGEPESAVALSKEDYTKRTGATQTSERDVFEKAWRLHAKHHLRTVSARGKCGRVQERYLPVPPSVT